MADAMYAPVCSRFSTLRRRARPQVRGLRQEGARLRLMKEWTAAAMDEPEMFNELEMEF